MSFFHFEAITLCNMNHVQKSAVLNLDRNSEEYVVAQNLCGNKVDEHLNITATGMLSVFRKVLVKVCFSKRKIVKTSRDNHFFFIWQ